MRFMFKASAKQRPVHAFLLCCALGALLAGCNLFGISPEPTPPDQDPDPPVIKTPGLELETTLPGELVFSSVQGTASPLQSVTLYSVGDAPVELENITISGPDAASFALTGVNSTLTLGASQTSTLPISFNPLGTGVKHATLSFATNVSGKETVTLELYGLGTLGEQGENEPTLQDVVSTLGYNIDVGGDSLTIGKDPKPVGDEITNSFFTKAGDGPVELQVVARFGPEEEMPFGFFTFGEVEPEPVEVGRIGTAHSQQLWPPLAVGSTTFDPGNARFGIFTQSEGMYYFSLDSLNTSKIRHAMRIYPLRNRQGVLIPDSYLLGFEEASNGDYQDVVLILSNVNPADDAGLGGDASANGDR